MSKSKLHKLVGNIINNYCNNNLNSNLLAFQDFACMPSSKQKIPLFILDIKKRETNLCNVDIIIVKNNKIKIVIEVDESDIKPTQICGKFLTTALSNRYEHNNGKKVKYLFSNKYLFIQIIKLDPKKNSKKEIQIRNLESGIKAIKLSKKTVMYKIIYGAIRDFQIAGTKRKELLRTLKQIT
jgi:hypothetical protein